MQYPMLKPKMGRPQVPEDLIEKVMEDVENGDYVSIACKKNGIGLRTLYNHAERSPELKKRLEDASRLKGEAAADAVGVLAARAYRAWRGGREDTGLIATAIKAK